MGTVPTPTDPAFVPEQSVEGTITTSRHLLLLLRSSFSVGAAGRRSAENLMEAKVLLKTHRKDFNATEKIAEKFRKLL